MLVIFLTAILSWQDAKKIKEEKISVTALLLEMLELVTESLLLLGLYSLLLSMSWSRAFNHSLILAGIFVISWSIKFLRKKNYLFWSAMIVLVYSLAPTPFSAILCLRLFLICLGIAIFRIVLLPAHERMLFVQIPRPLQGVPAHLLQWLFLVLIWIGLQRLFEISMFYST